MIGHAITHRVFDVLGRQTQEPLFPVMIGACAFAFTMSFGVPVEALVVAATLMCPPRWMAIGLSAAVGSTLASTGLYWAFHHLGWNLLIEWYPEIAKSKAWDDATRWLSQYGTGALFVLMAFPLPVPKIPALAFAGIYRLPIYEVVLAIGAGKVLKYSAYALVVSRFPDYFAPLVGPHQLGVVGQRLRAGTTSKGVDNLT